MMQPRELAAARFSPLPHRGRGRGRGSPPRIHQGRSLTPALSRRERVTFQHWEAA